MREMYAWPPADILQKLAFNTPSYMRPTMLPFAMILEGFLTPNECGELSVEFLKGDSYQKNGCDARTRDIGSHALLEPIEHTVSLVNSLNWEYDLDETSHTWLQTYLPGDKYQLHMDAAPGQMRKLTAVVFLTPSESYNGGLLELYFHPQSFQVPPVQGTIVVFQPWILHEVHPITAGHRLSLNMGFWGPNFK